MSHAIDPSALARLLANRHHDPHSVLGAHPVAGDGRRGIRVASYHPDATRAEVVLDDGRRVAAAAEGGLFVAFVPGAEAPLRYQWSLSFADGHVWQTDDPYRFLPSVGELDLHLLSEGTHRRLWEVLGAHVRSLEGVAGVAFAVWAPNAERVSVVGDFCGWDGRRYPMRSLGRSGVFELFIPGLDVGTLYKFEILGADGEVRLKTDPMATAMEIPPDTASRVTASSYAWGDGAWREKVRGRDARREPWAIYEVHLGSWARVVEERHRPLSYREIAPKLVRHVRELGFNAIELLPVTEHPFFGSWGYQVSGYYAPTARYGAPDDLRYLIDHCHQNGVAVLMDWVPAHFPKDTFALARFDGTALYEHADPRRGEHPDWGTLIFNYGRPEVRNFLIANALYWLEEFHVDGLRVDAVASMLYLDYSRRPGAWVPNPDGSRENHDAVAFLRALNDTVHAEHPEAVTVAEESTAWPGVTAPTAEGGLGFTFKWNMGWMHDTLHYFQLDPIYRGYHQNALTFAMAYEHSERFVMPLSHDEVVHGKGSLYNKMPGDPWQKLANLRLLYTYQVTRPGKMLWFMGAEIAPEREWNHDLSLDWHLRQEPGRAGLAHFLSTLLHLYGREPAFWRDDPDPHGFAWIDHQDHAQSVLSYVRRAGERWVLVVLNFTPVPRHGYRVGVPPCDGLTQLLSTDALPFGGSGVGTDAPILEHIPAHGQAQSVQLSLPPLGGLILAPSGRF